MASAQGRVGVFYSFVFWTSAFFLFSVFPSRAALSRGDAGRGVPQPKSGPGVQLDSQWPADCFFRREGMHGVALWWDRSLTLRDCFSFSGKKEESVFFCPFKLKKKNKQERPSDPGLLHSLSRPFKEEIVTVMMVATKLPPLTGHVRFAQSPAKCFWFFGSLSLHHSLVKQALLWSPQYRWVKWDSEQWISLSEVTQLVIAHHLVLTTDPQVLLWVSLSI